MNDSEALQQREDDALIYKAASAIAEGQRFETLEEFALAYDVSVAKAVALLASAEFQQVVRQITKAKATLAFASVGLPRLVQIAATEDAPYAMSAIRTLGELDGSLKSKRDVNIKLSLETLMSQAAKETVEGEVEDVFEIEGL